ncbi:AAA family ATPase [Hyphomicrobium sp.]|uniref:AAA family ATPase n=1 Tax=Hyphomicrobium sp. TaxID=82 RepID=UPI002E30B8A2|nr:AAA family ATPase [Hyphomicrobium sp.]HEX2842750.1 AAA family ATPase [Hyphomicrobium sp.]
MKAADRFIVITGGPGSGKSTLIDALRAEGFTAMPEGGRVIIQQQVVIGGTALPWADRRAFADLMLSWDLRSYQEAEAGTGLALFDRGVPDVVGYLDLCGLPVPPHVLRAAEHYRYRSPVFIAPPWPEIFTRDTERKQSPAEAEATYRAMVGTYSRLGYELLELPRAPVTERVAFVKAHLPRDHEGPE